MNTKKNCKKCRYNDCSEQHQIASEDEQVSCNSCRKDLGLDPLGEGPLSVPGRKTMTREQLISVISDTLGMKLQDTENPRTVNVVSPTGVVLFKIMLSERDGHWKFGGTGEVLNQYWYTLCRIDMPTEE